MKTVVTGGAGFIGSHLVDALLRRGAEVICLDDLSSGSLENLQYAIENARFQHVKGDILDERDVDEAVRGADAVFHLAARVGVLRYVKDPLDVLLTNIDGTRNILESCRKMHVKTMVLASTSEIYGKNQNLPLREDCDRVLGSTEIDRWSYSTSKAVDEHLAFAYHRKHGLDVILLRYFNVYGPRQEGSDYGGVISIFAKRILDGRPPQVHGSGRQTRCFLYVDDAVEGSISSVTKPEAAGQVFNIGGEREITILDLAHLMIRLAGRDGRLEPELIPYSQFYGQHYEDIPRRVPDTSKARKALGFEVKVQLEDGLARTIEWYRSAS